jgi:autotransporter-associated beta strand protein
MAAVVAVLLANGWLSATAGDLTWNVAGGGNWDYATANWTGSATTFADGDSVTFNNANGGAITVTANVAPSAITVSASAGTYTFNGGPVTGAVALAKSGSGTAVLAASNALASVSITGGTLQLTALGAIGSAVVTAPSGTPGFQLALPANSVFGNNITVTGTAEISTAATNSTIYTGTLTVNTGARVKFYNNGAGGYDNNLLILTTAAVGGGNARISRSNTAISNPNQLPSGNLDFADYQAGLSLILDGVPWSGTGSLLARYPAWGAGVGQMTGTYLGFAARGGKLTIDAQPTGLAAGALMDRNWNFGNRAMVNGQPYADGDVEVTVDGVLTNRRTYSVAMYGPGLTGQHEQGNQTIISGNLSGTGVLALDAYVANQAELLLAGLNTWTGSYVTGIGSGTPNRWINTGRGGMAISGQSGADCGFCIFTNNGSLPTGAQSVGLPAYLAASSRLSVYSGYLFGSAPAGSTYTLPSQYKFLLGGANTPVLGSTGLAGSTATLSDSAALLHSDTGVAMSLIWLVRGGTLLLGESAKPVKLQPSASWDTSDLGLTAAATTVSNNGGTRTLIKRGTGTLVLRNLAYTQIDGSGDTASQFVWQIGRGSGNNQGATAYFDGAVRGLADGAVLADNSNSLKNFAIGLRGGVYEVDGGGSASTCTRARGTAAGQVNWGTGGGGFAAFDGNLTVNIGGAGESLVWASTANFVPASQALVFGSTTATHPIELQNPVGLQNAQREIQVIDNPAASGDWAVLSGQVSSSGTSGGITKAGDGVLVLSGANTYTGATTVAAGSLYVNGSLNAQTSTVTVNSGATLGGTGTINRAVSVSGGAKLVPGYDGIGTLTVSNLVLSANSTNVFELGTPAASDKIAVTGDLTLDGVLIFTNAPGFASGSYTVMTYGGSLTDNGLEVSGPTTATATVTAGAGAVVLNITYTSGTGTVFMIR